MPNIVETADVPRSCHRHWVVAPLLLLVAIFSSSVSLSSSETPPEIFPKKGEEVLLQDDGMVTTHRNDFSLYGMHGAFTVTEQAGHMSIAALTTPVLVRGIDDWSIVPIGFQWRSDERNVLLPLPPAFQYAKLQELSEAPPSPPPPARWDPSLILPRMLRLPAARQRHEDMVRAQHLSAIARRVARGQSIAHMVQDSDMSAALSSEEGHYMLPSLLAEIQDAPLDRAALFPFLFREEEGALLTIFHPAFRDHAALFGLDSLSPEARALYHRTFPYADLLPDALSPLVVSRWEDDVARSLADLSDPLPLFAELLDTIEYVVKAQSRYGYVERLRRHITAMQHLSSSLELTPELKARLDDLLNLSIEDPAMGPVSTPTLRPRAQGRVGARHRGELAEREPAEWEDLKKRAVADLTAQGGMFTSRTTIEPLSPTAVRVASLVLATSQGDEFIDFTYDIEPQEVSDIVRGSTRYPYAVSLSQFVEWVRSE